MINASFENGAAFFRPDDPFDPAKIFDCGQCFRFEPCTDGFSGIARGHSVTVKKTGDSIIIRNCSESDFKNIWYDYFDLGHSYNEINAEILSRTPEPLCRHLSAAIEKGCGIRILRQEPWETLVSFIISQNNNIPRIKKLISALCRECGEQIPGGYAFPEPRAVALLGEKRLCEMKFGFRASYIADAAKKVLSGEVILPDLYEMSFDNAFAKLCTIRGVGPKVASCVLLFGYGKTEAFPIDVWIKRVIDLRLGGSLPDFGQFAGVAQQYLFYYERYSGNEHSN